MTGKLFKKFLSMYSDLEENAKVYEQRWHEINDQKVSTPSSLKFGERRQNPEPAERVLLDLIQKSDDARSVYLASMGLMAYVLSVLESLPRIEREYAMRKYIDHESVEEIEQDFAMSSRNLEYRLLSALNRFYEREER